jgi:hypothetical protein
MVMTYFQRLHRPGASKLLPIATARQRGGGSSFAKRLSSMCRWIGDYIDTLADHYAAAAMYEQLSRLSDAELQRRGFSRQDLARDVLAASDRANRSD